MARPPPEVMLLHPVDGGCLVVVSGTIDARFESANILPAHGEVVMDVDAVSAVTSYGVREWVSAMSALDALSLTFVNCRPSFVSQLNMVKGFAGRGVVASLYLPLLCEACDEEHEQLIEIWRDPAAIADGAEFSSTCPTCGGPTELDDDPAVYLSFVRRQAAPRLSAVTRKLLEENGPPVERQTPTFEVNKRVLADTTSLEISGVVDERLNPHRLLDGVEGEVVVLLSGVSVLTRAGAERLGALAQGATRPLFFAEVPVGVLIELAAHSSAAIWGRIVSVRVGEGEDVVDLDSVGFALERERAAEGVTRPELSPALIETIAPLISPEVPAELEELLATRRKLERERSGKQGRAPPADENIESKYEIIRRVGRGGMGEVLLARQKAAGGFNRRVVLKRIRRGRSDDHLLSSMLLQEARTAAHIQHANVVQILDLGRLGDDYCIVMEYVPGWDLRALLGSLERLGELIPFALACRIGADVASGLHAAHRSRDAFGRAQRIVHRDVSPENVLISSSGVVKITDFGVSRSANAAHDTKPGTLKGKYMYSAPELIDPRIGDVDRRADVFALGLVLFEILTLRPALDRGDRLAVLRQILAASIPEATTLRPDVPESLLEIIRRATQREPDARTASAQEVGQALEACIAGLGEPAAPVHLAAWLSGIVERAQARGLLNKLDGSPDAALVADAASAATQINSIHDVFTDTE